MKKAAFLMLSTAAMMIAGCGGTDPAKDTSNRISLVASSDVTLRAGEMISLSATASSSPAAITSMNWSALGSGTASLSLVNSNCAQKNVNTNNATLDPTSSWVCSVQITAPATVNVETIFKITVSIADTKGNNSARDINITVKPNATLPLPADVSISSETSVDAGKSIDLACAASGGSIGVSGKYIYQFVVANNADISSVRIIPNSTSANLATFTAPTVIAPTNVTFACRATDDALKTGVAYKTITINPVVNPTLVAEVSDLVSLPAGATISLDGSLSMWYSNGTTPINPQPPIYYWWKQSSGSPVKLLNPSSIRPTVIFPSLSSVDGSRRELYTFTLTVSNKPFVDGVTSGITSTTTGIYFVNYVPPISIAVPIVAPAKSNTLATAQIIASGQSGAPLYYAWTQVSGPPVSLAGWNTLTVSFLAPTNPGPDTKTVVLRVAIDYAPITPNSVNLYYTEVIIPITP